MELSEKMTIMTRRDVTEWWIDACSNVYVKFEMLRMIYFADWKK